MSKKSKKMVPTGPDDPSGLAETTSETTTTIYGEDGLTPAKPGRGKKKATHAKESDSVLKRLVRLEKWARRVCQTVPTIPRHDKEVDDDIEGT